MNCPECRFDSPEGMKYCGRCGAPLAAGCARCGSENPPGFRFCGECGQPLAKRVAGERPAGPPPPPRSVLDYTPRHLADRILTSRSAIEGERKRVTVLFADVKGSMDLAEQVDPEAWHRILNRFFEILTDGVHRFEGTVNQYTGDGIMALFGAPITHEDHAHRACYAALGLRDALRDYAGEIKRTEGLNFAVRMGINSGEVVVGKIGDDLRMDYTAQGHTVGLAARLEQLADPGMIHVSENTARLVAGFFRLKDLGSFRLKGVREPVRVHELEGLGEMRTRLDVSRARGLSRFVGRDDESRLLDEALARAESGEAQIVSVVAGAGVGKSRLCYEFAERCRARGIAVRQTTCVAHGRAIPYLPVLEFMRGYFGVTGKESNESARRSIAGTLLMQEEDFRDALPIVFEFLGVPDPAQPVPKMDPEARRRRLFDVMGRLIHAEGARKPSVILVEDLHWIDAGSEAFLEHLSRAILGTKTLLLVNFRPEYGAGWLDGPLHRAIPLRPLGPGAMAEFLRNQLGDDPSLRGVAERIQARTAGNPFFIEEVIQSLVESGTLAGERGAYRLEKALAGDDIPPTVQTLIAARIDRLPEREKQILQTAAVIGKTFPEKVLAEVASLPGADVEDALRRLVSAEFLYEESIYPEREYAFRHPLSQEVAYSSQLGDRRKRVHAAVARAIEKHAPEKLDERAALIAQHWEGAGEAKQAADWHYRAAEWAGLRDPAAAFHHWRQMKARLDELPETPETLGASLMARVQTLNFAWRMGVPEEEAEALFREADALADRHGLTRGRAILRFVYSGVKILAGSSEEAVRLGDEAFRIAEEIGDEDLLRGTLGVLAYANWMAGDLERALALTTRAMDDPPDDVKQGAEMPGFSPYLYAMVVSGYCLRDLGRYAEARGVFERTAELAEEHDEMEILNWALGGLITVAQMTGSHENALAQGRRCFEIADRLGSAFSRVIGFWDLASAHALAGNAAEARSLYEQALAVSSETSAARSMIPRLRAMLAEACLSQNDTEAARRHSDAAVNAVGKYLAPSFQPHVLLTCAGILLRTEGKDAAPRAGEMIDRAAGLAREMGMRCWLPLVHEQRAALAGVLGDEAARRRELEEAGRLYREMGAEGHAGRLEREIGA